MANFETPEFLKNWSAEEVFAKIKKLLPSDIDVSAGGHEYNMTWPPAAVVAEICEFILPEVIRVISPDFSYGDFLTEHARNRTIYRRSATAATGEITITGKENTFIPAESIFSTAAVNDAPSVDYKTLEAVTIPNSGSITVQIECVNPGIVGNTMENTIVLVSSKLKDITAVTNEEEVSGGTEEESDESLIARIVEYDQSLGESFIGNIADYKRWAKEAGAGEAKVIPAKDDSGMVTLIVTDPNGDPATDKLIEAVYNKIMRPDNPDERLAPVNSYLSVLAPATISIGVKATIELETGSTIEAVKASFASQLALYLPEALEHSEVKFKDVAAVLAAIEGAYDFKDLQIGVHTDAGTTYSTSNIPIADNQLPSIDPNNIILTAGTV